MSQQIIQINFRFNGSAEYYKKTVETIAAKFANAPGLQWKIWLMNESKMEAGGIYLFESREAVTRFRESVLFKSAASYPEFSVKQFDVLEEPSMISHAPLTVKATGY